MRKPTRNTANGFKSILSYNERQNMKRELADLEVQLKNGELSAGGWSMGLPRMENEADMRRKYRDLKRRLEEGSPEDLTSKRKRYLDQRIKELEQDLKRTITPHKFYHQKRADSKDYDKTVKHLINVENDPARVQKVLELKSLRRERDPDDPDAGNIEYLRKSRKIKSGGYNV